MKTNSFKLISIAVLVVSLSFSSCSRKNAVLRHDIQQSLNNSKDIELIPIEKLVQIIANPDNNEYQFIDIRNSQDFSKSHVKNAVNIPFKKLVRDKNKILETKKVKLLYSYDASQAKVACCFLRQKGNKNIIAVGGGFEFINNCIVRDYKIRSNEYNDENPKYNYSEVVASTAGNSVSDNSNTATAPKVIAVKKNKTEGNVGGCE